MGGWGSQAIFESSKNKVCGCSAAGGFLGDLRCAQRGGPARGSRGGCKSAALSGSSGGPLCWPQKRRFLGFALVTVGFLPLKSPHRRGFEAVLPWLKKDGLVRRCPQGLCGAPGVCVKGGPSRGPGRGGYSGALSGSSGGAPFLGQGWGRVGASNLPSLRLGCLVRGLIGWVSGVCWGFVGQNWH